MKQTTRCFALVAGFAGLVSPTLAQPPVRVILDMDAGTPGIQDSITVPPGTASVSGLAVYIYDPASSPRTMRGVGFFGGLDRGIAIGHQPSNQHIGSVTGLTGHAGTPIVPGAFHALSGAVQKGFDGPELHYIQAAGPDTPLPASPAAPVFTVDISLAGAAPGDVFRIYLLDMVTVWRGTVGGATAGAFTTRSGDGFDTGGDCIPDLTLTAEGPDPDPAVPVPPASFLVDYIDSQSITSGGGRIIIASPCYANCDNSTGSPALTANDFQCFIDRYVAGSAYANCDGSTLEPVLTANDFICFLQRFIAGCG